MAQFRSTADLVDRVLLNSGEVTNGNSAYEAQALEFLNRVHYTLIAGGTIPIGKDDTMEIDEIWPWSRSLRPLIIEMQPKFNTGTIALTNGSEAGTFSAAPTLSLQGYHIQLTGDREWYKIAEHTSGQTAFELDSAYAGTTAATGNYTAAKFDYELSPDFIIIDSTNDRLQFQETAATTLASTLTSGTYTPAALATEVKTQMDADGASVYTVTYSAITRKFTIASDRAGGGGAFILEGTGTLSKFSAHGDLGYDDINTADAASIESVYILGGISRLVQPARLHKAEFAAEDSVYGIDPESFQRDFPFTDSIDGNPTRFTLLNESEDGILTVRFNRFPKDETRVQFEYVKIPRDLKDGATSIPLVPRKHIDVLEDAATFYIMLLKSDSRAETYANLVKGKIKAMISQNRGGLQRQGKFFGQLIPRREDLGETRRRSFRFGYDT